MQEDTHSDEDDLVGQIVRTEHIMGETIIALAP
jgi:hypothetical protein